MSTTDIELRTLSTGAALGPSSTRTSIVEENESTKSVTELPPANKEQFDSYPEGAFAWIQVAAAAALFASSIGGIYTWGVLQEALVAEGVGNASTVSWIGSTQATVQAALAILIGRLVAHYGARNCAVVGSLLMGTGPLLASFCVNSIPGLIFTEGLLFGLGESLLFFSCSTLPSSYFLKRRNLATGLVYSGGGIGGAILSIVVGKLLQRLSIAWTLRVFSLILVGASLPAALIIRSRLPRQPFRSGAQIFDLNLFKNPSFCFLLLGTSIAIFPLFVPPFFLPLFARSVGLDKSTSSYLLAGYNLASAAGRIGFGIFADARLGSLNSLILCLGLVSVSALAIWPFSTSVPPLVAFAIVNGFCAGGMFSLIPGVVSSMFGSARLTLVFSTLLTSWSPGYFLGVPIAGYLLEAAGGPEGGIAAFGPAIWYAGGLSSLSTVLLSVPKIIEVRQRRRERAEQ